MKSVRGFLAVVGVLAVLTGCTAAPPPAPPPTSGLDLSGFDRGVRPQDDPFRFVNGSWLRSTEIPPDRSRYGAFDILTQRSNMDVRAIAEELDAAPDQPGSESQKIADLYASFMDTATVDRLGAAPLRAELARIDALSSPADVVAYFGYQTSVGLPSPVNASVDQDARNASAYILQIDQGGITMPDRDYYLAAGEPYTTARDRFGAYVTQMLGMAGVPGAAAAGATVLALETRLAKAEKTNVELRDAVARYNKFAVAQAPGLDWTNYLRAAGIDTPDMVVGQPSFFTELGAMVAGAGLEDWKTYLRFTLVDNYAPYLSTAFADAAFEFHGKLLQGQQEQRPRWERAVGVLNNDLGEAVGRRYVERHFAPASKQRMDALVHNLITAFRASLDGLDWMGEATKAEARKKLDTLVTKIGYPERWKDYSALEVRRDDLVGNLTRSAHVEHAREIAKLGKPIDRTEWSLTPQTINAYYNPSMNEIVFPAGILQPPFFDPAADDAVNYGGIGAVIGHEMSHGFDDQGRKYDETGNLRDWWTPEDVQHFTDRTAGLVKQYSAYQPVDGGGVNGELTLGENIADLSGVDISFKAYRSSLGGGAAPELDGFTGDQRFFLGWAQVWRSKIRDAAARQRLLTDPHSPDQFRVSGVLTNAPGFYEAFGLTPTDKLFRPAEQRIGLW